MSDQKVIAALGEWFRRDARDLPWRKRRMRTGYAAMVAEMMLQQTQVARVVEYFPRFMRAFPTVAALAAADEQDVLSHWQGLGYYRRARSLHSAAKMVVNDFGGRVPSSVEELIRLPGVGRYTAGAIASIVFGEAAPIVDGNVERVLMRVSAKRSLVAKPQAAGARKDWAWSVAERMVSVAAEPGVFNEALMELGATVCVAPPAKPRCDACPIAKWCEARKQGMQDSIPAPKARAKARAVHHHAVIITRPRTKLVLLEQRGDGGMWAGMWQTPTLESDDELEEDVIRQRLGLRVSGSVKRVGEFTHATTHRTIRFHVYTATSVARKGIWRDADDCRDLPMSNAQRKVLRLAITCSGDRSGC